MQSGGQDCSVGSAVHGQLSQHVGDMHCYPPMTHQQFVGDLAVNQAERQVADHVAFALGEPLGVRATRVRRRCGVEWDAAALGQIFSGASDRLGTQL